MPNPILGILGASIGGSVLQGKAAKSAAGDASAAQLAAAQMSVAEQRRQFNRMRSLLKPYVGGGNKALTSQMNLIGLGGAQKQRRAINRINRSPQMRSMLKAGEQAILTNASATGGLRGGNTQAALAEFRPQLLNQLIGQQLGNLGGLTTMGQNSAAGVGNAGMQMGANIGNTFGQMGQAQAGAALAAGQANANMWGGVAGSVGNVMGQMMPAGGMPAGSGLFDSWGF